MSLNIRACTSNNENGGCGSMVAEQIRTELTKGSNTTDVFIINCQEVDLDKTKQELEKLLESDFVVKTSKVRIASTKMQKFNPFSKTGMGTVVVYRKDGNVSQLEISPKFRNAAGTNQGKGGQVNTLYITDKEGNKFTVQSTAGHLDSNDVEKRMKDYRSIRQQQFFDAHSWKDLCRKTPHLSIDGMDINTRSVMKLSPSSTGSLKEECYENLWEIERNDPRIAPIYLAGGGTRFSGHATYKTPLIGSGAEHVVKVAGKNTSEADKRFGDVNTGSLDHITVVNATDKDIDIKPKDKKKYFDADINIGLEANQTRDHHFLATVNIQLGVVNDYDRVRNYIALQLAHAAPILSAEIQNKLQKDTPANRLLLQKIHQEYLSPNGELIQMIKYDKEAQHINLPESLQNISGLRPLFSVNHTIEKLNDLRQNLEKKENSAIVKRQISDIDAFLKNPPKEVDIQPWFKEVSLHDIHAQIEKMPSIEKMPNIENMQKDLQMQLQKLSEYYKKNKQCSSVESTNCYEKAFLKINRMISQLNKPITTLDREDLADLREALQEYKQISKHANKIAIMDTVLSQMEVIEPVIFREEYERFERMDGILKKRELKYSGMGLIAPDDSLAKVDPITAPDDEFGSLDMDAACVPENTAKSRLMGMKHSTSINQLTDKATIAVVPSRASLEPEAQESSACKSL